jgi:hypothetical protein
MFKILHPIEAIGSKVYCEMYATTKEEVTGDPLGLPGGRELTSGSWGFTQAGDLFIYDETTGYKFVGDEEDSSAKTLNTINTTLGKTLLGGVKPSVEEEAVEEEPIEEIEE